MSTTQDKNIIEIDTDNITFMFSRLRLPSMKNGWERLASRADAEGWPAARRRRWRSLNWPTVSSAE